MFNRLIKCNKLTVINRKYGSIVTGANLLYEKLKHNNVNDVFMYSGEIHSPLLDEFNKGNIKYFIIHINKILVIQQQDMLNHQVKQV